MLDSIDLVSPFSVCLSLALCLHDVSVMSGCLGALRSLPESLFLTTLQQGSFDYLVWIDSDVVEFPADLPTTLILANPQGVTAPVVLIEEPGPLGPSQFYDTTGFVLKGRSESDPTNTDPYVEGRSVLK
jgi:hypothetical protein